MPYATVEEFVAAIGEREARVLAPVGTPSSDYDDTVILDRLESASATLDTFFAVRFPTPVDPVPRVVRDAAIALAWEALDKTNRAHIKAAADRVRSWAAQVAKGLATIGGGAPGQDAPAPSATGGPSVIAAPATFGDQLGGYLPGLS